MVAMIIQVSSYYLSIIIISTLKGAMQEINLLVHINGRNRPQQNLKSDQIGHQHIFMHELPRKLAKPDLVQEGP